MMGRWLHRLGSLRLTLAALLLLAGLLIRSRAVDAPVGPDIAVPLGVLVVNLLAAVSSNPRLYRQAGLLVFHLGLAALAAIGGIGQLTAFKGRLEVTEGTPFDPTAMVGIRPWLLDLPDLDDLVIQGPFTIDYAPGMQRRETRAQVAIADGMGGWREVVVGDDKPLLLKGYRFYTSPNKGFAPILTWTDAFGRSASGAVNLPAYPLNFDRQGNEFKPPGLGRSVLLWLEMPRQVYDEGAAWTFRPPDDARLAVVDGERREVLAPGQEVDLGGGRLRYERLSTWMGYTVFYDPTMPWLIAAAVATILGLGWHVVLRLGTVTGGVTWTKMDHDG